MIVLCPGSSCFVSSITVANRFSVSNTKLISSASSPCEIEKEMAARRYLKRYPKSDDECQAWIAAVSSSDGKVIEGVSKSVKHRLRKLFFVDKGQLKEKETGLPVFVLTDFPNLWQKYHIDMNCPGLKATKKLMAEAVAGVPESEIEKARRRCEGCKLKGIIPKAPVRL